MIAAIHSLDGRAERFPGARDGFEAIQSKVEIQLQPCPRLPAASLRIVALAKIARRIIDPLVEEVNHAKGISPAFVCRAEDVEIAQGERPGIIIRVDIRVGAITIVNERKSGPRTSRKIVLQIPARCPSHQISRGGSYRQKRSGCSRGGVSSPRRPAESSTSCPLKPERDSLLESTSGGSDPAVVSYSCDSQAGTG